MITKGLIYGQCRVFWVNYCAFCLNSFWFVVLIWKMKPEFSFSLKYQGFDVCWFAKWLELKYKGSVWFVYFGLWFVDYDRIIKNIERGEARISRKDEIMKAIGKKLDRYRNPWLELKIQYGQNKGKLYNEECDRFMVWILFPFVFIFAQIYFFSFMFSSLFSLVFSEQNSCVFWLHLKLADLYDSQTWLW